MKWLVLLLLLAGCNAPPDGYAFEKKEFERLTPSITVVVHPSLRDLKVRAPAAARVEGRDLRAWSLIRPSGCEVHIVDPAKSYQPQWIGHEVTHCIYGRWHK